MKQQDQHILDYLEFHNEQMEWFTDMDNRQMLEMEINKNKWIEDYVKSFPVRLDYE